VAATDAMSIAGARAKGLRNADNCRPAFPSILPRSTERIPEQSHEALMPPGQPIHADYLDFTTPHAFAATYGRLPNQNAEAY
jgi:hypothetical protein